MERNRHARSSVDRARLEVMLGGRWSYLGAPLVLAGFAALGVLFGSTGRMITAGLETGVPLAAGLAAASMLASEPALELQLAVPGGVRPAILMRVGAVFGWSALVSAIAWLAADLSGAFASRVPAGGPIVAQQTWLAPLAAFTVAGALLAVAFRSRAMASGTLMAFWVAGHAFHSAFESEQWLRPWYPFLTTYDVAAPDWLATRLTLVGLAIVALVGLAATLGAAEWLLASEDR